MDVEPCRTSRIETLAMAQWMSWPGARTYTMVTMAHPTVWGIRGACHSVAPWCSTDHTNPVLVCVDPVGIACMSWHIKDGELANRDAMAELVHALVA